MGLAANVHCHRTARVEAATRWRLGQTRRCSRQRVLRGKVADPGQAGDQMLSVGRCIGSGRMSRGGPSSIKWPAYKMPGPVEVLALTLFALGPKSLCAAFSR